MANVMHSLETGQYVPETGWYEKGLQAKLTIGLPVEKNQEGANRGGHQVVQPKRNMVQRTAPLTGDTVITGESLRASRSDNQNKTGLPDRLKAGVESLSGYSMDDVRVHYNSEKPAQLQALAYTQGTEIHVGPGQQKHLAHEAWHVVQQKQGRVRPTKQMKGVRINEHEGLEREADVMGDKALAGGGGGAAGSHENSVGESEPVAKPSTKYQVSKEEKAKASSAKTKQRVLVGGYKGKDHKNSQSKAPIQRTLKQPLITNYRKYEEGQYKGQYKTVGHTLEDNPRQEYVWENIEIVVDEEKTEYTARDKNWPEGSLKEWGHLDLYSDNQDGYWINHIEVKQNVQRMGIARLLVKKAIEDHGDIYASNSHYDRENPEDTRHLLEDGAGLVNSLIKKGIMKQGWLREPVL
ncbi:MAG: DUF4157 domain-containing protein [Moorea sp. SIO2I5]|nr:DUF4157 domain-containing protein [Moorena sp. SIO2I5]